MTDLPARWQESQIGNDADPLSISVEKIGIHKGWQPIQGDLIGFCWSSLHKDLLIVESTTLIKTPNISACTQRRRATHPAEQTMHRWVHPRHDPWPMIKALITAHPVVQQIAQEELVRNSQGVVNGFKNGSEQASPGR
jgi:hypothetical protein